MKQKVFISSTYLDLKPFRNEIRKNLSELDIEILGMEKFGARKNKPLDTCLEEVDKSNVYIGIIAYKYGSIEKKTGKSFTQLEYERAVNKGKEILIYLFDEEGSIQPKFIDFGENAFKLQTFKNYLKECHTIDTFKTPKELSKKVYEKLRQLIPTMPDLLIRPQVIEAEVSRFVIDNENWVAIVGYLNEKPYELYTIISEDDVFPIPENLKKGFIVESGDDENRVFYNFVFVDNYGYTNTMGGINHIYSKEIGNNCIMINTLLKKNVPIDAIKAIIEHMDLSSFSDKSAWKFGVMKALKIMK